jgi:hypothetical protein
MADAAELKLFTTYQSQLNHQWRAHEPSLVPADLVLSTLFGR